MSVEKRKVDIDRLRQFPEIVVEKKSVWLAATDEIAWKPSELGMAKAGNDDVPVAGVGSKEGVGRTHLDFAECPFENSRQDACSGDITVCDQQGITHADIGLV
jgi:hypothetical protein